MSDLMTRFPAGSAVLAVRFPTTARAVRSLGGPRLSAAFAVVVDDGRLSFVGRRRPAQMWELPVSSVHSVSVAETRSLPPYPRVALAIVLRVQTSVGFTELPIVPMSDDGKRSLTWKDAEVRAMAMRLADAMKIAPGVS